MSSQIPRKRLTAAASFELEIRKSRFLAQATYLPAPDDASGLITSLSTAQASHNCWAWLHGDQYRFSDDGEPGGTAGRPILSAIENQGFDQCLVVITRWYGGIQLGTGGLARAYGGCAHSCLQDAPFEPLIEQVRLQCLCPYPLLELFKGLLAEQGGSLLSESFVAEGVQLQLAVPLDRQSFLQEAMQNLSRGEVQLQEALQE